MKNLIIILIASIMLTASNCERTDQAFLRVRADVQFDQLYPGIFRQIGLVSDFTHVYDSIEVVASRESDGKQYFFKGAKTPALDLPVGAGTYQVYIATAGEAKPIEPYLFFTAAQGGIASSKTPTEVVLQAETNQALILVQKSSVDGAPTIQVDGTPGLMSIAPNYYYAYVNGNEAVITYKQSGIQSEMQVNFVKANIYVLSAAKAKINITEPFTAVKQI